MKKKKKTHLEAQDTKNVSRACPPYSFSSSVVVVIVIIVVVVVVVVAVEKK